MIFSHFRGSSVIWTDILKRTVKEINADNCFGMAAQLAFYFMLSLFPTLLFLVALLAYLPVDNAIAGLLSALGTVAPQEIVQLLRGQFEEIGNSEHAGLLTIGVIGALWSSSAAMVAIIGVLNHVYDVRDWRPWWKRRSLAIGLTVLLAAFLLIALVLILIGPALASRIAEGVGLGPAVVLVWNIIRWPVMFLCVVLGVDLVYHFAPNRRADWTWLTPGALVATILWVAASFGFKFYVANVAEYAATYGTIGGIIVTMLWFYVLGLAMLVGAELNGVLEKSQADRIGFVGTRPAA